MQEETKRSIWKWLGYTAFFMAAFTYFFYRTFPYKQMFDRYSTTFQRRAKIRVKMSDLRPYWLTGVEASDVIIRKPVKKGIAAVKIDHIQAHASMFRLIFGKISAAFEAQLARGDIKGTAIQDGKYVNLKVDIKNINLNSLGEKKRKRRIRRTKKGQKPTKPQNTSLLATLFAPVYGRLKSQIRLKIPLPGAPATSSNRRGNNNRRGRRPARPVRGVDITKLSGRLKVNIRGLSVGPGEFPTAQMGELPVPLVRLGTLLLQIKIAKGVAEITRGLAQGADGEIRIKGSIRLRNNMRYAVFRGQLEFKINQSFVDNLDPTSVLKTGLGMLGPPPKNGFYRYKVRIPFGGGRPTFRQF